MDNPTIKNQEKLEEIFMHYVEILLLTRQEITAVKFSIAMRVSRSDTIEYYKYNESFSN